MVGRCWPCLAMAGLVACSLGCGRSSGPAEVQAAPAAREVRNGLDELRALPRAELAKKADEVLDGILSKEEARKKDKLVFELLPKWRQPLAVPGFQDLKFHADLGFSLPSYVNAKDAGELKALAEHFARAGDVEVARKLKGEKERAEIDGQQTEKHYPVEWTRYVALQLHALMQSLAIGEPDALAKLLAFRAELEGALDEQAKQGLLGQALLPRGRRILEAARVAFQEQGRDDQVGRIDSVLKDWQQVLLIPPLNLDREQWAERLQAKPHGRVVVGQPPVRALDFLQIPLPHEAADACLLFFDGDGRLEEILVAYNSLLQARLPQPGDLVGLLSDWSAPSESSVTECRQRWGALQVDTRYAPYEAAISGWVRLRPKPRQGEVTVPRDFGAVHLDWSFETNRLHSAPQVLGSPLVLRDAAQLAKITNPLPAGKLLRATLEAVPEHSGLLLEGRYVYQVGVPWRELALPLFAALGPGAWTDERTGDFRSGRTRIVWQDAKTIMQLEVPHQPHDPISFVHGDRRGAEAAAERGREVADREAGDRRQRIDGGQPLVRLPRKVDAFPLGVPRAEILKYLPRGQDAYRIELPDGLLVVNNAPPPKDNSPHVIRQVGVRFDQHDKLRWVRVRYEPNVQPQVGKKTGPDWTAAILGYWRQLGGAIAPETSPRKAVFDDLPDQPAVYYRWSDDLTQVTYHQDRSGVEITASDLGNDAEGKSPPPLRYLPRGPSEGIPDLRLGLPRAEFESKLSTKPVPNAEGGWVVALANGRYDVVAVWFDEGDRVSKIATRHRQGDAPKTGHKDMEKLLNERWGAELRKVGWPIRRDLSSQAALQAYAWHDDETRYRLFWADSDNSPPRLWSEWRDLAKPKTP